jgi:histidinol-phosphatase (PHP family)
LPLTFFVARPGFSCRAARKFSGDLAKLAGDLIKLNRVWSKLARDFADFRPLKSLFLDGRLSGTLIEMPTPTETSFAAPAFDYHSHHFRCGHATGQISDYIDAAIAIGLSEFGVSDHGPAYFLPGDHALPGTQMARSEVPHYVREALEQKAAYAGRIEVKVGVEADFIEGQEAILAEILESQPFDYALGSVHYVGTSSIFNKKRWAAENAEETYTEYYRLVRAAAASGLFDILSHLTAIESYGPPVPDELAERLYPPVADAVAAGGCIVEINTSGYRKMGGDEPFPSRRMLRCLIKAGVPLTFGSDCHNPGEVGYGHERVLSLLRELGVRTDSPSRVTVRRSPLLAFPTSR